MKPKFKSYLALFIATLTLIISCGGEMEQKIITYKSLEDVPDSAWKTLSNKKIFFGHQSVGNNIIAGIDDIIKENPKISLKILEIKDITKSKEGFIVHDSNLGKNDYPEIKINAFENVLNEGLGEKIDSAFMKFCFVDIKDHTDVNQVFTNYKKTMSKLKDDFPDVEFVHFTVPLLIKKQNSGIKYWIKKILGKADGWWADTHNIARNELNEMIVNEYRGKERIFDIAEIESTYPDGTRCTFEKGGKTYFSLVPEYTDDGGHLNGIGRKKVAEQLLLLLANL